MELHSKECKLLKKIITLTESRKMISFITTNNIFHYVFFLKNLNHLTSLSAYILRRSAGSSAFRRASEQYLTPAIRVLSVIGKFKAIAGYTATNVIKVY